MVQADPKDARANVAAPHMAKAGLKDAESNAAAQQIVQAESSKDAEANIAAPQSVQADSKDAEPRLIRWPVGPSWPKSKAANNEPMIRFPLEGKGVVVPPVMMARHWCSVGSYDFKRTSTTAKFLLDQPKECQSSTTPLILT